MDNTGQIPLSATVIATGTGLLRLRKILRERHCGKENAVKTDALLMELFKEPQAGFHYGNLYGRALRAMIEDLNNHGDIICSDTAHGYWWASSLEDGLPAAKARLKRAGTQFKNARKLTDNLRRHFGGQIDLTGKEM